MLNRLLRLLPAETLAGYENPELVETVFRKTLAYKADAPLPEISGARTVLDFGGGCGLHYKAVQSSAIRWAVIETPAMVARASELETDNLRFFSDIQQGTDWLGPIDVMHSNGALQYTPDPIASLDALCSLGASKMLWYRANLSDDSIQKEEQISRLADNGPGRALSITNKNVSYRLTKIPKSIFVDRHRGYRLAEQDRDFFKFVKAP